MSDLVFQYAVDYGGDGVGERNVPNQWEETGFATLLVPGVSVHIGTKDTPEVAGHSQENADLTVGDPGHRSLVLTTKVMAASALRLLMDSELREKVKTEHAHWVEQYNK
jgi:hypothetical protein